MPKVLNANSIKSELSNLKKLMTVELSFVVMGVSITIRSLLPEERLNVMMQAVNYKQNQLEFVIFSKLSFIALSIVELQGIDFRGVELVQKERFVSGKKEPELIKVPLATYLKEEVVSKWSDEIINVIEKKMEEVSKLSNKKAREGIVFEKDEDDYVGNFRVLLNEAKELEKNIPETMVSNILGEFGWAKFGVSLEEAKRIEEKFKSEKANEEPEQKIESTQVKESQEPDEPNTEEENEEGGDKEEFDLINRRALNQEYDVSRIPSTQPPIVTSPEPMVVRAKNKPPVEVVASQEMLSRGGRSNLIADIEGAMGEDNTIVIGKNRQDKTKDAVVFDPKPVGGINPKFQRPNR